MLTEEMQSSQGHDYFLYADTAATHEGELAYLKNMIAEAAKVKLDGIKFHLTNAGMYMTEDHPLYSQIKKWNYSHPIWKEVFSDATERGLKVIGLANDEESAEFLKEQGVYAIEVHASGLNDVFLLESLTGYAGFVLLGISGATPDETITAIEQLRSADHKKIYLVYGFQNYPTTLEAINFNKMSSLQRIAGLPLVYADHTDKDSEYCYIFPLLAYALGVKVIEKHLILNKNEARIDHESALDPADFSELKRMLDTVSHSFKDEGLMPNRFERSYRQCKKAIVAKDNVPKDKLIQRENLAYKRTAQEGKEVSITQPDIGQIVGRKARRDIQCDESIDWSMIK